MSLITRVTSLLRSECGGSILLLCAAVLAMAIANSPIEMSYVWLLNRRIEISIDTFELSKPLLLWINDGLMAIFFLLVGLELKREILEGELSSVRKFALPAIAALGGMVMPALIFVGINYADPSALDGWAIASATDIAFALGVLSLFGKRVPSSLKMFLLGLAIVDDVGAIVLIAIFYSSDLSTIALLSALFPLFGLFLLNRIGVQRISLYIIIGAVLWLAVLKSGVHATLAGVLIALFVPNSKTEESSKSALHRLEHDLYPTVSFFILPLFAFANCGVSLQGVDLSFLAEGVVLGIIFGLFAGNQIGVMGFSWVAVRFKIGQLPEGTTWGQMYGVSLLCGIGFTMSLFIGSLAFEHSGNDLGVFVRIGILVGSIISAAGGYIVLNKALPKIDFGSLTSLKDNGAK